MADRIIAVCGKGGVGKTTVAAIVAGQWRRAGRRALVIDADHAGGLATALAIQPRRTVDQVRRLTLAAAREPGTDRAEVALSLDYLLQEAVAESGSLAFLAIGRPEERGCYCSVNRLLREAIELLAAHFDLILIDAEAGIEQVNREVMRRVDRLLLVADATQKALRVAETIHRVAAEAHADQTASLVLNRISPADDLAALAAATTLPIAAVIPEDPTVRRFDASGESFFDLPNCPAAAVVAEFAAAWDRK